MSHRLLTILATAITLFVFTGLLCAQTPAGTTSSPPSQAELAKQLSNPVASLVSVPFQMNWDSGVGPEEDTRFLVNFQPVMPFSLNKDWNLIARLIVPILSQPPLVPGGVTTFGTSDILFSAFFSPARPRGFIWGVGPILQLPTTSDPFLGTEKWAAGPTVVVLKQAGPWTCAGLVNHLWSYAGDSDRADVNQTLLQPVLSYQTRNAVTLSLGAEATANWEAPSGEEWTVPIIFSVSKLVKLGHRPMSIGLGYGRFVEKPEGGPSWKLRAVITLLFPK
jgi:hypothetical protein